MMLLWFANFQPKKALTKVDKVSMRHDVEQKYVFDTTHKRKSINADWRWIRNSWGAMLSSNYFPNTYQREYDAAPEWWGDAKGFIAGVNTMGTFMSDLFVLSVGTILFSLHIYVNIIAMEGDALTRALTPRSDISIKQSIKLSLGIGNINFSINRKLLRKSQFKNLNRLSKWRL